MARRNRPISRSPSGAVGAGIVAGLFFIIREILLAIAPDAVFVQIANRFGTSPDVVRDVVAGYLGPGVLAALLVYVAYRVAYYHLANTVFAEDPKADAMTLTPMRVSDVAEYILSDSKWGWSRFWDTRSWETVQLLVPHEMKRAAERGLVRFIGNPVQSRKSETIDPAYWLSSSFDELRIWDARNSRFTDVDPLSALIVGDYENGRAPQIDVLREWPEASRVFKWWCNFRLGLCREWWNICGVWEQSGERDI